VVERPPTREPRSFGRPSPNVVEELEDGDASTTTIKWMIGIVAVIGLAVASVLLVRFAPWNAKPKTADAPAAPPAQAMEVPPLAPAPTPAPPPPAVAPAESTQSAPPPAVTQGAPTETTHAHAAAPSKTFGVAVASFLDESRAEAERSRLAAVTKLGAQVRTVVADSVSRFELVLGSFTTQSAAERVASDLISRGVVDEARVVTQARKPAAAATPH
jgi:cell division protein FtsN